MQSVLKDVAPPLPGEERDKDMRRIKVKPCKIFFSLILLASLFFFGVEESLSQPASKEDTGPQIELGRVTFRTRETEAKPETLRILEIHIEVFNRSRQFAAPAHSTRVVVVPKEIRPSGEKPVNDLEPALQEVTVNVALPPRTGRAVMVGFSLPKGNLASITFEIQVNPPDGDKKIVTWTGD